MSITCTNCGKEISYVGGVCPYCGADKGEDKKIQLWIGLGAVIGIIIGIAGYGFNIPSVLAGAFGGMIVGPLVRVILPDIVVRILGWLLAIAVLGIIIMVAYHLATR